MVVTTRRMIYMTWAAYEWYPFPVNYTPLYRNDRANLLVGPPHDNIFEIPFKVRHVPRQPTDHLDQIQDWLHVCRSHHDRCRNWCSSLGFQNIRPTRVLELSQSGVRLRCDTGAIEDFEYIALSHMWGKDTPNQPRLTVSTLQEYQLNVPSDALPDIFSEAIRVTRYLGLKYLWIDSLCIIQGSKSDWTIEASMMSAVYSNAVCVIAFLFPPRGSSTQIRSTNRGYFETRPEYQSRIPPTQVRNDPRSSTPCIIREPTAARTGICIVSDEHDEVLRKSFQEWPWASRAWTFQERLLSPRTILYGHRTNMWECVETFCDELTGTIQTRDSQKALLSKRRSSISEHIVGSPIQAADSWERPQSFDCWLRLVDDYRMRELTHPSDRIMAFSGVAQSYQAVFGFTYLAGIWKEHLPFALLWSVGVYDTRYDCPMTSQGSEPELYHILEPPPGPVPTWSWFASPIYLLWVMDVAQNLGQYLSEVLFLAKFSHFRWCEWPINHVPPTAFHDFDGLQITLELATYTITTSLASAFDNGALVSESLRTRLASLLRVKRGHVTTRYDWDDFNVIDQRPTTVYLALVCEGWKNDKKGHCFEGLGLAPGVEEGTYKRVGYWCGHARCEDEHTPVTRTTACKQHCMKCP
jgi:hypothetical protein